MSGILFFIFASCHPLNRIKNQSSATNLSVVYWYRYTPMKQMTLVRFSVEPFLEVNSSNLLRTSKWLDLFYLNFLIYIFGVMIRPMNQKTKFWKIGFCPFEYRLPFPVLRGFFVHMVLLKDRFFKKMFLKKVKTRRFFFFAKLSAQIVLLKVLKIAKFEFMVTVHSGLWAKCTQMWPLNTNN